MAYKYIYTVTHIIYMYICTYTCTCTCTLFYILIGYKQLVEWILHHLPGSPQGTMSPAWQELQHLLVPGQGVRGLGTIHHECRVEEALDESDVAFFFEEAGHFLASNDVTEDSRGNLCRIV
jgi:hypothetical protein